MAKDPETLRELREILEANVGIMRIYEAGAVRAEARLKLAEAVCEAWAEYEPVKDLSALCGKQHMALQEAYKAYLAGKGIDDG